MPFGTRAAVFTRSSAPRISRASSSPGSLSFCTGSQDAIRQTSAWSPATTSQ